MAAVAVVVVLALMMVVAPMHHTCSQHAWNAVVLSLQTIIPLGLRDRRQPSTGVPDYSYKGQKQLNTTILFDPMAGPNSTQALTCAAVQADLPNGQSQTGIAHQRFHLRGCASSSRFSCL